MSNKGFWIIIIVLVGGFGGFTIMSKAGKPKEAIVGVQHADQGAKHIAQGSKHETYNSVPASSGSHYADASAPTQWGVYTQEVPPEVYLHNEEHGGVVITYNPKLLPAEDLKKLQSLFALPYSNKKFSPTKAIVTPRAENTHALQLTGWRYTLNLDKYDEATLMKFYLQRVGKSPESMAGPSGAPINQARE